MAISTTDLLVVNGLDVTKIATYQVDYERLYADGTGRDMDGNMHADLIGIFTKLEITVGQLDIASMKKLLQKLNDNTFNVTYYDPMTDTVNTELMYVNDHNVSLKNIYRYDEFEFHLIAYYKRS